MIAENGKVFKIKNTNYYLGKEINLGDKLIVIYGEELDEPIVITEDIIEQVNELPLPEPIIFPEDEEVIE